jgi:hypothetical protein
VSRVGRGRWRDDWQVHRWGPWRPRHVCLSPRSSPTRLAGAASPASLRLRLDCGPEDSEDDVSGGPLEDPPPPAARDEGCGGLEVALWAEQPLTFAEFVWGLARAAALLPSPAPPPQPPLEQPPAREAPAPTVSRAPSEALRRPPAAGAPQAGRSAAAAPPAAGAGPRALLPALQRLLDGESGFLAGLAAGGAGGGADCGGA